MNDLEISENWKKAILSILYKGRPRRVDLSLADVESRENGIPFDSEELFDVVISDLRAEGLIDYSMQPSPAGQVFDARLTPAGVLRHESANPGSQGGSEALLKAIARIRAMLISVSTGGETIQRVENDYQELFAEVDKGLRELGIDNPITFYSLWDWYGVWSAGDLPTYQSRRKYISELLEPLIARVRGAPAANIATPTGWPLVDRQLSQARHRLSQAKNVEDFQGVGHLCREVLISLAQAVFDPASHPTESGIRVSPTDFKRMIEGYISVKPATCGCFPKPAAPADENPLRMFLMKPICTRCARRLANGI